MLIKNGFVVDPKNDIYEIKDLAICDGKIVDSVDPESAEIIDAEGRMVVAGGVEIHVISPHPKLIQDEFSDVINLGWIPTHIQIYVVLVSGLVFHPLL